MTRRMKGDLPDYDLFCNWCQGSLSLKGMSGDDQMVQLLGNNDHLYHLKCLESVLDYFIKSAKGSFDEWLSDGHLMRCPVNTLNRENECRCEEVKVEE